MDRTLRLAPLLAVVLLALPTASAGSMQPMDSPCVGPGVPPRVQPWGCGPTVEVQITVRIHGPTGLREYTLGSCDGECDVRVDIEVVVCKSTTTVAKPEAVFEGQLEVPDGETAMVRIGDNQIVSFESGFLPRCLEDLEP